MQEVFVAWDNGRNSGAYDNVNKALRRGARVVLVSSAAPAEAVAVSGNGPPTHVGQTWAVTIFVLEGTEEQLGLQSS